MQEIHIFQVYFCSDTQNVFYNVVVVEGLDKM